MIARRQYLENRINDLNCKGVILEDREATAIGPQKKPTIFLYAVGKQVLLVCDRDDQRTHFRLQPCINENG